MMLGQWSGDWSFKAQRTRYFFTTCPHQAWCRPHPSVDSRIGCVVAELADRMGVDDRACVSGLELGQRNPALVTLWHVTKALDVNLRALVEEGKSSSTR
jgi:transcriptional regulator with XRE-family HTH domain